MYICKVQSVYGKAWASQAHFHSTFSKTSEEVAMTKKN